MPKPPLPSELQELLAGPNPAVIATVRPDGRPHSVPTWYEWQDGRVLVNMDRSRSRLAHIQRNPRVALTIMPSGDWYSHVSILGDVVEIRDDPDLADIDRLAERYAGRPHGDRERDSVTAIIEPVVWSAWGNVPGA
jgi:PPOX class probable F420-dependent enzyme